MFAGSPAIAVPALRALAALEREGVCVLAGVLTNPDSARGRHGKPEPTEVGAAALEAAAERGNSAGMPVLKFEKLDGTAREAAAALEADLLVSFAYGRIFGPLFLGLFPLGGINVHPSLLPRYRGPTPIQAAILNGDTETGISIQQLALEMDAGDILASERFPLSGRETAETLSVLAAERAAGMLAAVVRRSAAEGAVAAGQRQNPAKAVYCSLLTKEEGRIDWKQSAREIDRRIRAFTPWPLCLTRHGEAELYVLAGRPFDSAMENGAAPGTVLGVDKQHGILIQTGDGIFAAERLQYRTKKALDWRSFLNGSQTLIGSRLK